MLSTVNLHPYIEEEWYDVNDDFIDDGELDAYFERDGRKVKLGKAVQVDIRLTLR